MKNPHFTINIGQFIQEFPYMDIQALMERHREYRKLACSPEMNMEYIGQETFSDIMNFINEDVLPAHPEYRLVTPLYIDTEVNEDDGLTLNFDAYYGYEKGLLVIRGAYLSADTISYHQILTFTEDSIPFMLKFLYHTRNFVIGFLTLQDNLRKYTYSIDAVRYRLGQPDVSVENYDEDRALGGLHLIADLAKELNVNRIKTELMEALYAMNFPIFEKIIDRCREYLYKSTMEGIDGAAKRFACQGFVRPKSDGGYIDMNAYQAVKDSWKELQKVMECYEDQTVESFIDLLLAK